MLAILTTSALEHDMVELIAADRERVIGTSVRREACLPRVEPNPARGKSSLS